jgi:2-acylglycerol O-acyltransferase 2
MLIYFGYIFFIDVASISGRGRKSDWFRKISFFKHFKNYFPIHLHKTVDLDNTKNYVFGYHPHGIIGIGAFVSFGTEALNFSTEFPGIDARICTLPAQFWTPFWREVLLAMGLRDSSFASCVNGLRIGPGSSIVLVVGGAQESLYSKPGTADLCLKKRTGFVKVALSAGATLVPVFGFGETDLWDQLPNPEGSLVRKFQDLTKQLITFTFPLINGRGIFQYGFGLMPQRRTIHVVVGKPIDIPKSFKREEITPELVEKYHTEYINALTELYHKHKDEFIPNRKRDLTLKD